MKPYKHNWMVLAVLAAAVWGLSWLTALPEAGAAEISVGQRIDGKLGFGDERLPSGQIYDEYVFLGTAGEKVIISLSSKEVDTLVWLLDADRNVLVMDDDSGGGTDSVISNFSLPADGVYLIWATTHSKGKTGAYTLTLNLAPATGTPVSITLGQTLAGSLDAGSPRLSSGQYLKAYSFFAEPNQSIRISMNSTGLDACLWLLNSQGRVITLNNDSRNSTDARIIFIPKARDTYTIWASSYNPGETGSYSLTLSATAMLGQPIPLNSGNPVNGTLDSGSPQLSTGQLVDVYAFNGIASQKATISLTSNDFDNYLRVFDRQGKLLKNTDSDAISNLSLPASGTYLIWASSVFAGSNGAYNLSLNLTSASAGTLTGRVTNACSGNGISQAIVSTTPIGYFTTTDSDGYYTLSNMATGTYTVNASADKYAPASVSGVVTAGQTTSINFDLSTAHNPVLTNIPDIVVDETAIVSFTASATDQDGDSLSYTLTGWKCGSGIAGPHFSYTTVCGDSGLHTLRVTVNDGACGTDYQVVGITVVCQKQIFYQDADGDGYGNSQVYTWADPATPPAGYVSNNLDCDDTNPDINPNTIWYKDANGDGYSDGTRVTQCIRPGLGYYLSSQLIASHGDYCDNVGIGSDPRSNIKIYVDAANTGSGDGSQADPYKTIQQAIDAAGCGDTIVVNTGVYTENVHFLHKSLYLKGSGANTIIDGYGRGPAVTFDSGENRHTILDGFSIRNGSGLDIGNGLTMGGGVVAANGSSPMIVNNIIYSNQATYGSGIACAGSSPMIMNNTIVDNLATSGGGIAAVSDSFPQVTNTIIWSNANDAIFVYSSAVRVTYSDVEGGSIRSGNINSDSQFKDAANRNYRLQYTSPCIDTGIASGAPAADIEGITRPQGAGYDMGAYEYRRTPPSVTVNSPNGGEVWAGRHNILWTATDIGHTGTGALFASLYYGHSVSGPWTQIASGIACTSGIHAGYAWDTTPIAKGTYYIRVVVSDGDGGSGADVSNASFKITRDHTPPGAPEITSSTHPDQKVWYSNNSPVFNWIAYDESGISSYAYLLNRSASTVPGKATGATISAAATASYTGKADGVWYFHVRAKDGAGNWGAARHYKVKIDTIAPGKPRITSSTHPNQNVTYKNNNPAFKWSDSDATSGIGGYSYILDQTADTVPDTTNMGTAASKTYKNVANGTWYFHVRAVDKAGNWGDTGKYTIHINH